MWLSTNGWIQFITELENMAKYYWRKKSSLFYHFLFSPFFSPFGMRFFFFFFPSSLSFYQLSFLTFYGWAIISLHHLYHLFFPLFLDEHFFLSIILPFVFPLFAGVLFDWDWHQINNYSRTSEIRCLKFVFIVLFVGAFLASMWPVIY